MEIILKTNSIIAEVIIRTGSTKIIEDVANSSGKIPDSEIENFITIAREMNVYNKKSDVDFVKMIYDNFLNEGEQDELRNLISK